jgi:hypothetical protein
VFTTPLHSNGNDSIVASVFIAVGMCLPSRCLEMNIFSDFTISASYQSMFPGRDSKLESFEYKSEEIPFEPVFLVVTLMERK